jgi:hypothetical protein
MFYTSWIAPKWMREKKYFQKNSRPNFCNFGKKVEDPISLGLESELKEGAATRVL